jgi:hypothetical protein
MMIAYLFCITKLVCKSYHTDLKAKYLMSTQHTVVPIESNIVLYSKHILLGGSIAITPPAHSEQRFSRFRISLLNGNAF